MFLFSLALAFVVAVASILYLSKYNFGKRTDQQSLFPRHWQTVSTNEDNCSFVMMTFNLLADGLSGVSSQTPGKCFCGVPIKVLDWKYRFQMVVQEILRVSPDVLCVQECDHIETLSESLKVHGYDFQFQPKDFSPVLNLNADGRPDGVGIFYKRDKFQLIDVFKTRQARHKTYIQDAMKSTLELFSQETIRITDIFESISNAESKTRAERSIEMLLEDIGLAKENNDEISASVFREWLKEPTMFPAAVAVRLRPRVQPKQDGNVTTQDIVILTTHLSSKKEQKGEEMRLTEVHDLFGCEKLKQFRKDAVTFFGGDLNCSPHKEDYDPLVYPYLVRSYDKMDESETKVDETCRSLDKPFRSAMRECLGNEPPYSTWKHRAKNGKMKEAKHTIDFLLFDSDEWLVSRYFSIPTENDVQSERARAQREWNLDFLPSALPSAKYPSDHFALAVEFVMK